MDYIGKIYNAEGLAEEDADLLRRLIDVFDRHQASNSRKMSFYEDKFRITMLGMAVPDKYANRIGARTGWAAKAVDYLAARCIFDGFSSSDADTQAMLNKVASENSMSAEHAKGMIPELVHGCGFWTVSKGGAGEPSVIVNFHSAAQASGILDYRRKCLKAGMVVEDYRPLSDASSEEVPCAITVHTDNAAIMLERVAGDEWVARYVPHRMGRPMMEAMCYRPTDRKLGKSRITPAVMDIVSEAEREIVRMAFASEANSQPLRYMLGAGDAAFDVDKYSLAYNAFLLATKDEDGDVPTIGQLQAASPEPHIKIMEHYMCRMSGETGIPVSSFGLSSNGYTSSDALRASSDDLILEAESLNRTNGAALRNVAVMALAVIGGTNYAAALDNAQDVTVHWRDPSMPSIAATSDAMVKQAGVADWLTETSVYWEKLGYSEDERMRLLAEKADAQAASSLNAILLGQNVRTEQVNADTQVAD